MGYRCEKAAKLNSQNTRIIAIFVFFWVTRLNFMSQSPDILSRSKLFSIASQPKEHSLAQNFNRYSVLIFDID